MVIRIIIEDVDKERGTQKTVYWVGHWDSANHWHSLKSFDTEAEAATYLNFLNGGSPQATEFNFFDQGVL